MIPFKISLLVLALLFFGILSIGDERGKSVGQDYLNTAMTTIQKAASIISKYQNSISHSDQRTTATSKLFNYQQITSIFIPINPRQSLTRAHLWSHHGNNHH